MAAILNSGTATAAVTFWQIDSGRSDISFTVTKRAFFVWRLLVRGRFEEVESRIRIDAATPLNSHVSATIQARSIDTGNALRDMTLRGRLFFDVKRFPAINFESRSITPIDPAAGQYQIEGDLTIHGVTRPITLDARIAPGQHVGLPRLRFAATASLDRSDFGLTFNSRVFRIGHAIVISLAIEAVPQGTQPVGES